VNERSIFKIQYFRSIFAKDNNPRISCAEATISSPASIVEGRNMIDNKNLMQKLIALSLAFIGVAAMVFAWFVLLATASHDMKIVAIEVGGVVVTISGYFLWQYSNRQRNDMEKRDELPTQSEN
jgi:hypothetical protein